MRFSRLLFPMAAGLCLMAQTSTKTPPKPPVNATPVGGSTPVAPPSGEPGATPTMTGPDGVTIPLEITPAPVIPPDRVVIQVGDIKLTAGQMEQILQAYPDNQRVFVNGPGRQQFIDQVVRVLLLAEEGKRRKLMETETFKNQLWYSTEGILSVHTEQDIRSKVHGDEALLRAYYEAHKGEYEQIKASHILIRMQGSAVALRPGRQDLTEAEALAKAQEIHKKLADGADFAELARTESDDMGSNSKGGDLGYIRRGQTVPSFEEALFAMKDGELSQPVKSTYGYHLIKVTERKPVKTLEELRPELEKALEAEASRKALAELKSQVKIVIDPDYSVPAQSIVLNK